MSTTLDMGGLNGRDDGARADHLFSVQPERDQEIRRTANFSVLDGEDIKEIKNDNHDTSQFAFSESQCLSQSPSGRHELRLLRHQYAKEKTDKRRKELEAREMEACTFKPQLCKVKPNVGVRSKYDPAQLSPRTPRDTFAPKPQQPDMAGSTALKSPTFTSPIRKGKITISLAGVDERRRQEADNLDSG